MSSAVSVDDNPDIDVMDVLRRIGMCLITDGQDRLGLRMLDALRPQLADPADIDASIALAEFARGDLQKARQRLQHDVLVTQPSHPLALLVKAACDRAEGSDQWQRGPKAVLAMSDQPKWRQAALDMLNA